MSDQNRSSGKFNRKSRSGNGGNSRHYFSAAAGDTPDNPVSDSPTGSEVAADLSSPFFRSLWEMGYRRALARGIPSSHPDDVHNIKGHASSAAGSLDMTPYDPNKNLADKANEDEIERLENDREALEVKHEEAVTKMEEVERERANMDVRPVKPENPGCAIVIASFFIALTIAPAFYDGFFYLIEDLRIAWLASIITSVFVGGGITYMILGQYRNTAYSRRPIWGLVAAVGLVLGLAIIRLFSSGFSEEGIILAVGLFLIEVGIVVAVEIVAAGIRRRWRIYCIHSEELKRFNELVAVAERKVKRIEKKLDEVNAKLQTHITHRLGRLSRAGAIENLRELCIKSALDGYSAGLAEIEGRFHGRYEIVDPHEGKMEMRQ